MDKKRSISKKKEEDHLQTLLKINKQYQQLLQKLAENNYTSVEQSPQSYLFNTLQHIKQLNSCMKQQLKQYSFFSSPVLHTFLQQKGLMNSSNLISKYESFMEEIEQNRKAIQELQSQNQQHQEYQALAREEKQMQEQMKRLSNRRIELRNKNEMIAYQIQCGETDLNEARVQMFEEQLKLRQIENVNKHTKKK